MKGRTIASTLRLVERWHEELGGKAAGGASWRWSPQRPMFYREDAPDPDLPPVWWELVELTNGAQLRREGASLKHCVVSYVGSCCSGSSRIWSLRRKCPAGHVRSVVTIEVDPRRKAVVQARGYRNRTPTPKSMRLLREWARREHLNISSDVGR